MKPMLIGTAAACAVLFAGAANVSWGATVDSIDGAPQAVQIDVVGHVPPRCGFEVDGAPQSLALVHNGATVQPATIPFKLDCNGKFEIRVSSANGALVSEMGAERASAAEKVGFKTRAQYAIDLNLGQTGAAALMATCSSEGLRSGAGCDLASPVGTTSEHPSMGVESSLTIRFPEAVSPRDYVAGAYRDVITIVVSAA